MTGHQPTALAQAFTHYRLVKDTYLPTMHVFGQGEGQTNPTGLSNASVPPGNLSCCLLISLVGLDKENQVLWCEVGSQTSCNLISQTWAAAMRYTVQIKHVHALFRSCVNLDRFWTTLLCPHDNGTPLFKTQAHWLFISKLSL